MACGGKKKTSTAKKSTAKKTANKCGKKRSCK